MLPCAVSLPESVVLNEAVDDRSLSACNSLSNPLARVSHCFISSDLVTNTSRETATKRTKERQGQTGEGVKTEAEHERQKSVQRQADRARETS